MSDNKAFLLTITYTWMLSSSNRNLRDRVSKAVIEVLKDHFSVCVKLLELFKDVNDPYILQRLYGMQEKRDLHYLLLNGRRIEKR